MLLPWEVPHKLKRLLVSTQPLVRHKVASTVLLPFACTVSTNVSAMKMILLVGAAELIPRALCEGGTKPHACCRNSQSNDKQSIGIMLLRGSSCHRKKNSVLCYETGNSCVERWFMEPHLHDASSLLLCRCVNGTNSACSSWRFSCCCLQEENPMTSNGMSEISRNFERQRMVAACALASSWELQL